MKTVELTGQRFGKLEVIKRIGTKVYANGKKRAEWLCKCDCGKYTTAITANLKLGKKTSCGCIRNQGKVKNLIGKKVGRLTVIDRAYSDNKKHGARWICKCECGNICEVPSYNLVKERTQSCGCLQKEKTSKAHKIYNFDITMKRIYHIYIGIKTRLNNKHAKSYKNYGGRGIKMCEEWSDNFINFYNWSLENGYDDELTIDRIDVNGNYEPSNCRWITKSQQADNKTTSIRLYYFGKQYTPKELSGILGIDADKIRRMFHKGMTVFNEVKEALDYKEKNNI